MKKIFLFAALAGIVFASCQKEASVAAVQNEGQQEITFTALSKAMTKGVLTSGGSFDNGTRKIQVAGVTETDDGKWVDFLEETTFSQEGSTRKWKATGKYYPLGSAATNFLAYSETNGVESTARWYGSKEVEIQVSEENCAENDIVYAAFKGDKSASGGVPAVFSHTQALVTVTIKTKEVTQSIIINKIGFEDVKTSGTLNIKLTPNATSVSTAANATATWLFNAGCTCHYAEMGARKLSTTDLAPSTAKEIAFAAGEVFPVTVNDTTGVTYDKLFPAQKLVTKTMVINYTLGDYTADARLEFQSGNQKTWAMGKQYKYTITVDPSEIAINPSAAAWIVESEITEDLS